MRPFPLGIPIVRTRRTSRPYVEPHVFNAAIDRLLRLDRGDRRVWLGDVLAGLDAFPAMAKLDRRAFLQSASLHDLFDRIVFRGVTHFPALAKRLSRAVPITGPRAALRDAPPDRPLILALMHFGPVHYVFTVLQRTLAGRTVYALHAGGEFGDVAHRYLAAVGAIPLVSDERALRTIAKAMADDPSCAVVISFDYLGGRARKNVPFLGATVPAGRGLAFLADQRDATVVTAWGALSACGPRVEIGGAYRIDATLPKSSRQDELTQRLFALLEARLRAYPAQWTEWRSCSPRARENA